MATPNPQLEAALAQFAAQPGTTPDQEAQLRAAIIADADRLDLLNRQAATGQLKGFALETPGGASNPTAAVGDRFRGKPVRWNAITTTPLRSAIFRRIALLIPLAAVNFTGCAHSISTPDSIPAKEAAAMTAPESTSTTDNPTLSAEEIGKRFLKLIEGLESREDLSPERIQNLLGVPLKQFNRTTDYLFGYSQPLSDGWYLGVDYLPESHSNQRGVSLDFGKPGERFAPFPAAVCALDFDYYHNALKAMGYRDVPIYGEIGELRSWRYYKNDITLSIIPQNVVAGEAGRLCVKSIGTLNGR